MCLYFFVCHSFLFMWRFWCPRLPALITPLIMCRVELHCFAWSFVSHVSIRSCLVSYQAVVVLRCKCRPSMVASPPQTGLLCFQIRATLQYHDSGAAFSVQVGWVLQCAPSHLYWWFKHSVAYWLWHIRWTIKCSPVNYDQTLCVVV